MREILGRRRKLFLKWKGRTALLHAALTYAERWQWRVVPGVGYDRSGAWRAGDAPVCACPRPNCPVPGAHPLDPGLLAATRDPRMVRWWWTNRRDAPVVLDHLADHPIRSATATADRI